MTQNITTYATENEVIAAQAAAKRAARHKRVLRMDRMIVRKVVIDALAAGYTLSVNDGGDELAIKNSTSRKAVMAALINTDEDYLIFRRPGVKGHGWVRFIYGESGWDVICDYSTDLDDVLAGANALAEKLDAKENN
jgi:hypothetical protein